jgi:hypothetical protein
VFESASGRLGAFETPCCVTRRGLALVSPARCVKLPLPAFLLPYLARQCEGNDRDDLLFPGDGEGGHLRRPHPTSGWFAIAVAASGIPRATPHDLRHSAASLAVSAGANVKAAQKMLGHASAAMTLDVSPTCSMTIWRLWRPRWIRLAHATVAKMWPRRGRSRGGSADRVSASAPMNLTGCQPVDQQIQKFQSSSSVLTALPIT